MSIQIICAWCGKQMGTKSGASTHPISHSICADCRRKVRDEFMDHLRPTLRYPMDPDRCGG